MPFAATWMDLEIIILSEVSQKEKRKILYDITYMWNLNKKREKRTLRTHLQNRNRLADLVNNLMVTGEREWVGINPGV